MLAHLNGLRVPDVQWYTFNFPLLQQEDIIAYNS